MKKVLSTILIVITISAVLSSCQNSGGDKPAAAIVTDSATANTAIKPLREKVLTAEEQKALTPDMVIQSLKEGNTRYMHNDLTARDHSMMVRDAVQGQYPKAVILFLPRQPRSGGRCF